ncbi:hypothetical protein ACU4GH_34235 [Bradyrhizobium betae]
MQAELTFSTDREAQQTGRETFACRPEVALTDEDVEDVGDGLDQRGADQEGRCRKQRQHEPQQRGECLADRDAQSARLQAIDEKPDRKRAAEQSERGKERGRLDADGQSAGNAETGQRACAAIEHAAANDRAGSKANEKARGQIRSRLSHRVPQHRHASDCNQARRDLQHRPPPRQPDNPEQKRKDHHHAWTR